MSIDCCEDEEYRIVALRFTGTKSGISYMIIDDLNWLGELVLTESANVKQRDDDEGFISDAKSVRRMELLVLSTLNWRMRPVTPFSFLHFFLSSFELRHPLSIESLKDRASEFIFKSHYGNQIELLVSAMYYNVEVGF